MRLRHVPAAAEIVAESPYVVHEATIASVQAVAGDMPLHMEIGMGKGSFITEMAQRQPDVFFVGIERYESVLYKACEKMAALDNEGQAPENLRFISADARSLPELFAPASIDKLYLNFSDPWPKERHAKRRLTSPQFLAIYAQVLKDGAILQFKTDQKALFDYSLETLTADPAFSIRDLVWDLHRDAARMEENVMTEYERKFSALGSKIMQLTAVFCRQASQ